MSKKIIALIIFAALILANAGSTALCDTNDTVKPTVSVGTMEAYAGDTVMVPVVLKDCPGFTNIGIEINYPDELTLTGTNFASISGTSKMASEFLNAKPYNMSWYNIYNSSYNGLLVNLIFKVSEDAEPGYYTVTVDYFKGRNGNYVDGESTNFYSSVPGADNKPIGLTYESGTVKVISDVSEIVVNAFGKQAHLYSDDIVSGIVFLSLYDDDDKTEPVEVKVFSAQETINYTTDKTGTSLTVMWWATVNGSLQPVCDKVELSLQ